MRVTTKGQVTIPKEASRGEHIVHRMRSAKINRKMTTEQIMEMTRGYRRDGK